MTRRIKWHIAGAIGFAVTMMLAACSSSPSSGSSASESSSYPADLGNITSLVQAAKQEGSLTWFAGQALPVAQATAKAFKAEFGITVNYIQGTATDLQQRYASEAQSGKITADVIAVVPTGNFFANAVQKGWMESLTAANLPTMALNQFPMQYFKTDSAVVTIAPFDLYYNKNSVSSSDAPKSFDDLGNPAFKNKLALVDPRSASSWIQYYALMDQTYGDALFAKIRANDPKFYNSNGLALQAAASGEAGVAVPATTSTGGALIDTGAPLVAVLPPVTTGGVVEVGLTAPSKAPHSAAAELFVNWLLSRSGNEAAQDNYSVSVFKTSKLPNGFTTNLPPVTAAETAKVFTLLGVG